jgi:hypothetical protein
MVLTEICGVLAFYFHQKTTIIFFLYVSIFRNLLYLPKALIIINFILAHL